MVLLKKTMNNGGSRRQSRVIIDMNQGRIDGEDPMVVDEEDEREHDPNNYKNNKNNINIMRRRGISHGIQVYVDFDGAHDRRGGGVGIFNMNIKMHDSTMQHHREQHGVRSRGRSSGNRNCINR